MRAGIALVCLPCLCSSIARAGDLPPLEPNTWVKVHEQKVGEGLRFSRQEHGGSCFDAKRGRIILFGSNTHGKEWTNTPLFFDVAKLEWSRAYPNDPFDSYTVTEEGLPVCGEKGDHPWASHTFGAVMYDDARDEMVVACFDDHLSPGRFTNVMKDLWPRIKLKPTWLYSCEKGAWTAIPKGQSFFPHCAAFDTDRKVVLGYRPDGVWELSGGEKREWTKLAPGIAAFNGWHTNCCYDSKHKALIVTGHQNNTNDIGACYTATKESKLMPTPGERPVKDQHMPLEFHPKLGKTVALVDRTKKKDNADSDCAETWLYDLGADAWTHVKTATLPFACGMNYNLEYDPARETMWLVTGGYSGPTTVWGLKLAAP